MFRFDGPQTRHASFRHSGAELQISVSKLPGGNGILAGWALVLAGFGAYVIFSDSGTWNMVLRRLLLFAPFAVVSAGLCLHFLRMELEEDALTIAPGMLTLRRSVLFWKMERTFPLNEVRGIRIRKAWGVGRIDELRLECKRRSFGFAGYIREEDANRIVAEVEKRIGRSSCAE